MADAAWLNLVALEHALNQVNHATDRHKENGLEAVILDS